MTHRLAVKKPEFSTWEYCGCSLKRPCPLSAPCGCGSHDVMLPKPGSHDVVVHWFGKHWRLTCAFYEATDRLDDLHATLRPVEEDSQ